ncbi:MAG TPA: hypothetical protein EYN51_03515 [Flavobacteriales bacterium]|jgi:hypothetical protein|nr:hypothetical protein [Flavobacteriales bacterium]
MSDEKWYNNSKLVDTLLFIIPPIGIYGVYKSDKIKSSVIKISLGLIGFLGFVATIASFI